MIKIIIIDEESPFLKKAIELGNQNKATLGFLPKGGYIRFAKNKKILVAVDEKKKFLGYLLYDTNIRNMSASIVHLCVKESGQRKGVAESLFSELKNITKDIYRGIRVRCRRDYNLRSFWSKLGFTSIREIPGRSKQGSTLTIWWFDHGHPTLFTLAEQERKSSKIKVVIDANVFYELQSPLLSSNKESQLLLVDWLEEKIELCITPEIYNEIDRHDDKAKRDQSRSFAESFLTLQSPDNIFQKISEDLCSYFPKKMSESTSSDLRHLARTIAAEVNLFVTLDKALLKKEQHIYDNFGVRIIRPSDLIVEQDALIREAEYQPARLSGSLIKIERITSGKSSILEDIFLAPQQETKSKFRQRLQPCLSDPHLFETNIIKSGEKRISLIIYNRQKQSELQIPFFRVLRGNLSKVLAKHLVYQAIIVSSQEKRALTKITDTFLSDDIVDALEENGFILTNSAWVKANISTVETIKTLTTKLISFKKDFPDASEFFHKTTELLRKIPTTNIHGLLNIERSLFPVKIKEIEIPCFIVPIQPVWAMHLFDPCISKQDIFGGDPSRMFNVENVYYGASKRKVFFAPVRILWYVSKGKGTFQGTMALRACSYLDEVFVDTPKVLYKRFRRLGVYKWEDVFKVAKENTENKIMAFRFSHTEIFNKPIFRDELEGIWKENTGRDLYIRTSISISNELFFRLYKMGRNL